MGALDPTMTLYYDFTIQQRFNTSGKILAGLPGLGPDLDFDRLGDAWRRGPTGFIEAVGTDFARRTYSRDVIGLPFGYLHEDNRTNLALWSGDMSNAVHVASNLTVETDAVIDPLGVSNTNIRLTATAANATLLQSITSGSATRSFSVYISRVTGTGNIDLTVDNGVTWKTVAIAAGFDGIVFVEQAAVTNPVIGIRIVTSGDQVDYWGEFLENSVHPTSTIITEGSTVTRAQDISDGFDVAFYNALEGTLFGRIQSSFTPNATLGYFTISDGSSSDQMVLGGLATDFGNARVGTSGAGSANLNSLAAVFTAGAEALCAMRVAVDDVEAYWNGDASPSPFANCDMPIGITKVTVGDFSGTSSPWNGILGELRYYDEGKNDQFLEDITNGLIAALAPSGSVSDAILLATGGPTINDGLVTFFLANGAVGAKGSHIDDLERDFLLAGKSPDAIVGDTTSDLWNQFLIKEGHTGHIDDMKMAYWSTA